MNSQVTAMRDSASRAEPKPQIERRVTVLFSTTLPKPVHRKLLKVSGSRQLKSGSPVSISELVNEAILAFQGLSLIHI